MRLSVKKFGPIENVEINVTEFLILIGKQSSGKSTVSKLIYYFLNIRDEVFDFTIECLQEGKQADIKKYLVKRISKRFVEFFGPSVHDEDMELLFSYNDKAVIKIKTFKKDKKYITCDVSENIYGTIVEIIKQNSQKFTSNYSRVKLFSSPKSSFIDIEIDKIQKDISKKINSLFGFSYNLLFIPAGRSILSTLSDQLQNIHPHLLDFPMRTFIQKVANTKAFFGKNLEEIIKDKKFFEVQNILSGQLRKSVSMIRKIIKGDYIHDDSGGRIQLDKDKYVKINFTSSGQQESIWIVLSLFLIVLEREDVMVFIEEPEAHLFPDGQKDVIEFAIMVRSMLGTRFIITTHSPYILSAINNALYADNLRSRGFNTENIIDRDLALRYSDLTTYRIENGSVENICSNELMLIDASKIDDCSKSINELYSKLEDLEFEND